MYEHRDAQLRDLFPLFAEHYTPLFERFASFVVTQPNHWNAAAVSCAKVSVVSVILIIFPV